MGKDIEKLLAYSLDQLDKHEKVKFEEDLEQDTELSQELLEVQAILENVAASEQPMPPSKSLRQSLIASLNPETPFQGYVDRFMKLFDLDRKDVESLFDKIVDTTSGLLQPAPLPKTSLHYFDGGPNVANATCGIIKLKAGSVFPAHQHLGKETVLVLQGTAKDQDGMEYYPGDTIVSEENTSHSLKIGKKDDLIFAVILEKPNKMLYGQMFIDYVFPFARFKNQ